MTIKPNEKSKLVKEATKGVDPRVDEILDNPTGELATQYKKVEELNENLLKKSYIEASLICENDLEKISEIIEIPVETLALYREFFFDVVDWDRLSKVEHIEDLGTRRRVSTKNEMLLKMWALTHGLTFISWRLGKHVKISPVEGLEDLFSTCLYKSKEVIFNNSSSEAAKESTKWTKLSIDIARLTKLWSMDTNSAKKELELAIREVVPEFGSVEEVAEGLGLIQLQELQATFGGIDDETKNED